MEGMELAKKLDSESKRFFRDVFTVMRKKRGYFIPIVRHVLWQRQASKLRVKQETEDFHVPPFMIFSITGQCNLNCEGCYSKHLHKNIEEDLPIEKIDAIIGEAEDLGISIILLAGGEPLIRKEVLSVAGRHRRVIFPIFTNGLLIDDKVAKAISEKKNILPVISLEGDIGQTDRRRGEGVYNSVIGTFRRLSAQQVLFGASITVTRKNFEEVTGDTFLNDLATRGCSIVFFVEYIPCSENSENLTLTQEQREKLKETLESRREKIKMIFVSFPGDEEMYGGCLAAGRGFIHVSSGGRVEPCPFSPYSDMSLSRSRLRDALNSEFLKKIRENHDLLVEHQGGCALWENREWVKQEMNGKNDV